MNSFTSSSDLGEPTYGPAVAAAWRRWLLFLVMVAYGGTALLYGLIVLLDPFATGRLTPFTHLSVTSDQRIFTHAGRVRNPDFDAVIIGNSRGFALEPARLGLATGRHFVHLGLEAAFHEDQLKMLALFAHHRAGRAPLILQVVDAENWCNAERGKTAYRMPWWLYEGSNVDYLRKILSVQSVQAAWRRLAITLGLASEMGRRDGFALWFPRNVAELRQTMTRAPSPSAAVRAHAPFPELADLAQALRRLEPASIVVLLMPPVFAGALPVPGSAADARLSACKQALDSIARARPNTVFVDARRPSAPVRNPMNFIDATHYLDPVAIPTEKQVIAAIKGIGKR